MIDIGVNKLSKTYFSDPVFTEVSFELKQGERIGLLGDNGTGKTTIFRMLNGEETKDSGEIFIRSGIKIGYLTQKPIDYQKMTVSEVLQKAFMEVTHLRLKMSQLEEAMTLSQGNIEKTIAEFGELQIRYEALGGYEIDEKLSKITEGMKLKALLNQSYSTLSGGEKMRVALSKLLLESPDVLLLDEPTNHLDIETSEWLEEYLKNYNGSVMVVSHDRYFLDSVITKIYELKEGKAEVYYGNYSYYLEEREVRYELMLKQYEGQARKIKQLETAAKQMRDWANRADNEKMYKRAKAMEKRIEKMDKPNKPVKDVNNMKLQFEQETKAGKIMLNAANVSVSIGTMQLAKGINFKIYNGEKIGLIGSNGCGKTTFLRDVIQISKEDLYDQKDNPLRINPRATIGYLEQDIKFYDENMTILDTLRHYHPMEEVKLRKILARYKFKKEDVFKVVNTLSGGERVRLKLCILILDEVNFLILDEPTNHIDIKTKEVLETSLKAYKGTILFISHDRYFLNVIASRIFEMENQTIASYIGNYEYYKQEKVKQIDIMKTNKKVMEKSEEKTSLSKEDIKTKKGKNPWKIKETEELINSLEQEIKMINEKIKENATDYETATRFMKELEEKEQTLENVMEQFFEMID